MGPAEFLADHTYLMVFVGTCLIGLVAGTLGTYAYLRGQSLISDVISHAALPGALLAFLALVLVGADGRNMAGLVVGAVATGLLATAAAHHVAATTRLGPDTAMAVTLSTFFGAGMLLVRVITDRPFPGKGGIQDHLFGNASVMTVADLMTIGTVGAAALVVMLLFGKEFALRTFDPDQSGLLGFAPRLVDGLMFACVVAATVVGVKSVGLVLMVALVVTPPAAARQWTRRLGPTVALAGVIGAVGSGAGAYVSVLAAVPPGPVIVLIQFAVLVCSLLLSPRRSIVAHAVTRARARRQLVRDLAGGAA